MSEEIDEIEEALRFDPLAEAEKITGKSYKKSEFTSLLGMSLSMEQREKKKALLFLNQDTYFGIPLKDFFGVIKSLGFKEILKDPVGDTEDWFYIFWRDGILMHFDTYGGRLNGGKIEFNYHGDHKPLAGCSNGGIRKDDAGVWFFEASYDVREGLRHKIETLEKNGTILKKWERPPFLWLLHYMDSKVEGYDYKAITKARVLRLPPEVQEAMNYNVD